MILNRTDISLLFMDQPWEQGSLIAQVAVLPDPDEDRLRMYYLIFFREDPLRNVLCVASSEDGYIWEKPDLGAGHNIVMRASGNAMDWGVFLPKSILYDPEEANPDWRWKMLFWERLNPDLQPGMCLAGSPDGYSWKPMLNRQVITSLNDAGSMALVNPRAKSGPRDTSMFIYQQTWKHNPDLPTDRDNLTEMHRVLSIWYSEPFPGRWIGPVQILEPNERDDADLQLYGMSAFPTETGYGALMNCHHTLDQTMDVQLISSADGWSWKRELEQKPLLPLGPQGRFDCGLITCISTPVRWKDKTLLYYNGRALVHDRQPRYPNAPLPEPAVGVGVVELADSVWSLGGRS